MHNFYPTLIYRDNNIDTFVGWFVQEVWKYPDQPNNSNSTTNGMSLGRKPVCKHLFFLQFHYKNDTTHLHFPV